MGATTHLPAAATLPGVGLVTGGASGIGRAVAIRLAHAGCSRIAVLDINAAGLREVKSSIESENPDVNVLALPCNTSNESEVIETFKTVLEKFQRVDYAINCAGVAGTPNPTDQCLTPDFDRTIAINLRGVFLCAREELRIMKSQAIDSEVYPGISAARGQRGAIVNVASGLAVVALPNCPAYCASKAGVLALSKADAIDYALSKIRVNAVLPGIVETPMVTTSESTRENLDSHAVKVMTPMKRWGQTDELADACLFLCSNNASFITGVGLPVDGGYLAM
ncbi:hypothetical protein B0A52_02516 [Exophiala mesophila]|uniref:Uncharacterized protein n=1 Tax=Exophiala mesophila TaxID=212818 RepID=A0A438ND78_EXOME|nr:hypothetical protein B0A52_02516 [Exophiala mesophila]